MNIKPQHFEEIIKKGYSLDILYLLTLIEHGVDIISMCENSVKIKTIVDTMVRKRLISDYQLTKEAEELLNFIESDEVKFVKKTIEKTKDAFTEWWECFPATNKFTYKGMTFPPSRSFKMKKEGCKTLFNKLINEKKYTAEEIIEATKYDVQLKKENSIKKRENQLTYLQNTYTYLYQESFEGFVELIKTGADINEELTIKGSTDI